MKLLREKNSSDPVKKSVIQIFNNPIPYDKIYMISDLNSLSIFEIGKKKFYFLGDQHDSKSKGNCEDKIGIKCDDYNNKYTDDVSYGGSCTSIGILLRNWFRYNTDNKINTDFYLELGFTKEEERLKYKDEVVGGKFNDESFMSLIASLMEPCFIREKKSCPYYPYVHAHYADVRNYSSSKKNILSDPFLLFDILEYIGNNIPDDFKSLMQLNDEILIITSIIIYDYEKIIKGIIDPDGFLEFIERYHNMSNFFSGKFGKMFIEKFENMKNVSVIRDKKVMHRTAGELLRLRNENEYVADLIEEFIYNKAEEFIKEIKTNFEYNLLLLDNFNDMNIDDIKFRIFELVYEFIGSIVPMSSLSMDAYLLARMFLQTESSEIITYTGSKHSENYIDFFENYLGVKSKISVPSSIDNRCIISELLPEYLDANKYREYVINKQISREEEEILKKYQGKKISRKENVKNKF